MQYIGFDIGIKNLAFCIVLHQCGEPLRVQRLEKIDLHCKKSEHQRVIDATIEVLDHILHGHLDVDKPITVLIESQMTSIMRCIQTTINTYFKVNAKYMGLDIHTKYISPKLKLNMMNSYASEYTRLSHLPTVNSYKQNKLDAVHFTTWLLGTNPKYKDDAVLNMLKASKKPDDECDCLLMTFAYIESRLAR